MNFYMREFKNIKSLVSISSFAMMYSQKILCSDLARWVVDGVVVCDASGH